MKDLHDSQTIDMLPEAKKRGRPPKGDKAMTASEKQAAYRARRAKEGKGSSRLSDLGHRLELWVQMCERDRERDQRFDPELRLRGVIAGLSGCIYGVDAELAERIVQLLNNPLPNSESVSVPSSDSLTVTKRSVPPARYVHPGDPTMTWTGRGRMPAWVKAWIDNGHSLVELEIS